MVKEMTYGEQNDVFFWQTNYHEGDSFAKIIDITYVITLGKLQLSRSWYMLRKEIITKADIQ